ncbi:MAG: hypothetical protein GX442_08900 [Candidatus Riflebacteria bacterium]|nr:hypothetical protein [Candidatus Riflebacteria bacterium]
MGTLLATCAANIVVVYLAAFFASSGEAGRNPQKAIVIGLVGGLLYALPVLLTTAPRGPQGAPTSADWAAWTGMGLSFVWYIATFLRLYQFTSWQVVAALVGMRIASRVVAGLVKGP